MYKVDIVLGCSFGDEGKGKVVYDLIKNYNYDLCVRFNGSGNAGHTIYHNSIKIVLHQLPIGILFQDTYNLISSDCLINIDKLKEEIDMIQSHGINIVNRLFISKACHIITNTEIDYDIKNNKVGTTGSGIGPTYANKMLRVGSRVENYANLFKEMGINIVDMRKFNYENYKHILLEGAQGFELDINWTNNYPYCTSSTCSLAGAINTGISIRQIDNIYGVSKIYDTYIGTMKFQPDDEDLEKIGLHGKEFGSTTGRKRQCNYLNLDNLVEALRINQCNVCIINKVDIIDDLHIFKLYHNNNLVTFDNLETMQKFILDILENQHNSFNETISVMFSSNPYTI
jgi:adenylosuccinate synthase